MENKLGKNTKTNKLISQLGKIRSGMSSSWENKLVKN